MTEYEIIETTNTTYNDKSKGIVNGVLIKFRIVKYDEIHEVRIPKMDSAMAKKAILEYIAERDALAAG